MADNCRVSDHASSSQPLQELTTPLFPMASSDEALPSDLKEILSEVAMSGSCKYLSWAATFDASDAMSSTSCPLDESKPRLKRKYSSLGQAVSDGIGYVLDHSFKYYGGYRLSPAESRRLNQQGEVTEASTNAKAGSVEVFKQRRQRLISLVHCERNGKMERDGPPFTIQRLAEVLVAPGRCYKQTHKLCNCLEKLLLVSSSVDAFGGSTGGETSQSRSEEREMAALEEERLRQEREQRNRRIRRRMSSASNSETSEEHEKSPPRLQGSSHGVDDNDIGSGDLSSETLEAMEAKAKASLRHKFDHAATPDSAAAHEIRSLANTRSMTNSPPPPSLSSSPGITMATHSPVASFVRHIADSHSGADGPACDVQGHPVVARPPSPILFSGSEATPGSTPIHPLHQNRNVHLLQMHHAAALAGVSMGGSPLELLVNSTSVDNGSPGITNAARDPDADIEGEPGRSSASNSDVDSESDDFSLDDSASDRSDGSDSGSGHYEPFSAARVMALNRMQQQHQRLQQSRGQMLGEFRPPVDSDDSIDSTKAEDSGSDSSDLAD